MIAKPKRGGFMPPAEPDSAVDVAGYARQADLWDAWRFAAVESALALKDWMIAGRGERELGYDAYLVCLDREEEAAIAVAEAVDPHAAIRLRAQP
jgi:hypothetical protein